MTLNRCDLECWSWVNLTFFEVHTYILCYRRSCSEPPTQSSLGLVLCPDPSLIPRPSLVFAVCKNWAGEGLGTRLPRPHPAHTRRRGLVSQVQKSWASSRSVEWPIILQSSVYWNNAEVRTSTSIVPLKVMLWNSLNSHNPLLLAQARWGLGARLVRDSHINSLVQSW